MKLAQSSRGSMLVFTLFLMLVSPGGALSQAQFAEITGTVMAGAGKPLAGATVTVTNGAATVSGTTDAAGTYRIGNVTPGTGYRVIAEAAGFQTKTFTDVSVLAGNAYRFSFETRERSTPLINIRATNQTRVGAEIQYRGNVVMTTDSVVVTSDELDFDPVTGRSTARGNVSIQLLPKR